MKKTRARISAELTAKDWRGGKKKYQARQDGQDGNQHGRPRAGKETGEDHCWEEGDKGQARRQPGIEPIAHAERGEKGDNGKAETKFSFTPPFQGS